MNPIKKAMCFGMAFVSTVIMANPIFEGKNIQAWSRAAKPVSEGIMENKTPRQAVVSLKRFDVDTKKVYKITGDFRIAGNHTGKKIHLLFGFIPYTVQNKSIETPTVFTCPYPLATVAKPIEKNATEVTLKGADAWKIPPYNMRMAFDAKADKSDLPNKKLSPSFKPNPQKNADGTITITLTAPIQFAVPAGTVVRGHMNGSTFIYTGSSVGVLNNEWQTFSNTITGIGNCDTKQNWWVGTAKAAVIFFTDANLAKDCSLQFRNIKVEEVTKP